MGHFSFHYTSQDWWVKLWIVIIPMPSTFCLKKRLRLYSAGTKGYIKEQKWLLFRINLEIWSDPQEAHPLKQMWGALYPWHNITWLTDTGCVFISACGCGLSFSVVVCIARGAKYQVLERWCFPIEWEITLYNIQDGCRVCGCYTHLLPGPNWNYN